MQVQSRYNEKPAEFIMFKEKSLTVLVIAITLLSILITDNAKATVASAENSVFDQQRNRTIPIAVAAPEKVKCTIKTKCPVALISAGYGVAHTEYSFLEKELTTQGYFVVSIAHELEQDPPLSVTGNLFETRAENWQRGTVTLKYLQKVLAKRYPNADFDRVTLVGHSNGGDISSWLANEAPNYVEQVITLDHRRVPLPRNKAIRALSIRASDYPADDGVLYTRRELNEFNGCIVKISNAKHNDMSDSGPAELKITIKEIMRTWLTNNKCNS